MFPVYISCACDWYGYLCIALCSFDLGSACVGRHQPTQSWLYALDVSGDTVGVVGEGNAVDLFDLRNWRVRGRYRLTPPPPRSLFLRRCRCRYRCSHACVAVCGNRWLSPAKYEITSLHLHNATQRCYTAGLDHEVGAVRKCVCVFGDVATAVVSCDHDIQSGTHPAIRCCCSDRIPAVTLTLSLYVDSVWHLGRRLPRRPWHHRARSEERCSRRPTGARHSRCCCRRFRQR